MKRVSHSQLRGEFFLSRLTEIEMKECDVDSISYFGSYLVMLNWKGEPGDTHDIKGQLMLKQHSESRHQKTIALGPMRNFTRKFHYKYGIQPIPLNYPMASYCLFYNR